MRCPSCGNENPDDYTFCDECGAKITPQGSEGAAPGEAQVQDVVYAPTGVGGVSAPLDAGAMGGGPAIAMAATKPSGGLCPNCGAVTVPGEAYCNECGAELASASAAQGGGAAPGKHVLERSEGMEPYMGATDASANGEVESGGVSIGVPVTQGVPVTEDTMIPNLQMQAAEAPPQAEAAQAEAMPGVIPIEGIEGGNTINTTQAAAIEEPPPVSAPMPSMMPETMGAGAMAASTASPSTASWASDALTQLEEAQQSMAKGDWVAYGQSVNALKAFLESIVKGTAPQVAGMDVTAATAPPHPVVDEGTAADIRSGGMAVPVPMPDVVSTPAMSAPTAYPDSVPAPGTGIATGLSRLVVIATGAEMPLPQQEEITVGREDPSSGIFPDIDLTPYGGEDGGVSRRHARLLHIGNDYYVEDLQSTNYTKLDGQRLPARVREKLEDGARLDFGRVAMIFRRG